MEQNSNKVNSNRRTRGNGHGTIFMNKQRKCWVAEIYDIHGVRRRSSFKRKVELERSVLEHILPKSMQEDTPRFEALLMLLSPEAWIRLRRDQGLSTEAAMAAIQVCIDAFISPQKT